MEQVLDCLVSYFGLDEYEEPDLRRYFCYHILGGPGPTEESGVAALTTLAVSDESERCTYCQPFHVVETGGPEAAIAKAIRYLDDVYRGKHLRKIQTAVRRPEAVWPADKAPLAGVAPSVITADGQLGPPR
jgi:hypothetical protein